MKRFYNNTKMSGAFSSVLRVFALLCVLLGFSSSAWGQFGIIGGGNLNLPSGVGDIKEMSKNGSTYTYTITTKGTSDWFRIYKLPIDNNNQNASCLYSSTENVALDTEISCSVGQYREFKLSNLENGGTYTFTLVYTSDTNIKLTVTESVIDYSKRTIYFKNTLGWTEVYAYMDIYWDSTSDGFDAGAGANGRHSAVMEYTGCDNIWKAVFQTDIVGQVAFSKDNQSTNGNFDNTEVVARSDYSTNSPMFIPYAKNDNRQIEQTKNVHDGISTKYYNEGEWNAKPAPTATQIILDISKHTGWKISDAFFKAILYNGSDVVNTYSLTQCPYDNNIYFSESGLVLSNCTHVEIQRWGIKDEAETKWNTSGKLELTCDNNCVEINGWDNSAEITKYEGECADVKDLLLLSREANIDTSNKTATLYGYLKFTDCDAQITEYGFYYCPSDGCIPTENSKLQAVHQGATGIQRGTEFSAVLNYTEGVRYGYRSYAVVNGKVRLSKEVRYFGSSQCNPQPAGQPINVTVDGAQYGIDYADNCNLIYGNLQLALDNLESHDEKEYIVDGALQQDITITVYQLDNKETYTGKTKTVSGGTGGGTRSLNVNVIEDINKNQNDNYKLTIKAAEGHNPRIQHLLIRDSRNIEIDGLNIISNPTNNGETEDTALEIDAGKCSDWVNVSRELENANILIKNCMIGSNGFTGVHATGCSGISFENNTFNLIVNVPDDPNDAEYSNIVGWGASAKFFACKNIKFVRNNFMGAHPTLVWLQQSSNALFYNNVFWNTNEFVGECVAVRLVNQWGHNSVGNIAFFYNTFYLADNVNNKNYDFLRYKIDVASAFDESSVYFQYNNCYSYDTDIPGKASSGTSFVDGEYCPNNYWSIKSDAKFDIKDCGDDTKNINVSNYVCETSASGPASLIIKQPADPNDAGLKVGTPLKLSDIKTAVGTDILFTQEDLTDDRYNENIREGNAWTLGAYEQSASNDVETIYWVGGVDDKWDNRNNWVRIDATGQARRLTCVDNLSPTLKIVIPQENSTQYPISTTGKYFYPEIPASFDAIERENATVGLVSETKGIPASEQVSAGVPSDPTKYAKTIELEYGAALKGVHRLWDKSAKKFRYDEAISHMTVGRDEWTLVGTIVKPSDGNGDYRFITSNDYFCNYTPQVYMHKAKIVQEGEFVNATWGDTFADLDKGVEPTTVYAINVPDQYGKYKAPSRIYYKGLAGGTNEPDKLQDGVKPHSFGPFTGRFVNDASMPKYGTGKNNSEDLTGGTAYLFNNSYPCNIDPEKIQESGLGNIMCYDYDGGAFVSIDARAVESTLKPQHGFIFIPTSNGKLTINEDWLVDGETKSRSAQYEEPIFSIQLDNAEYGLHGYSNLVVKRDELLADNEDSPLNVRKVIAPNENTPEIYAIAFDEELARICVNNMSKTIPLGIYLHKPMSVKFSKCYSKNILSAILVDTYTNKEYDLMDRSFTTETLASGNLDGRFFLNLTTLDEDYYVEDEEDDDNVSTDVEENTLDENAINIFVRESDNAIRVLTSGVELRTIYVSDMSGRTMRYNVKGYSASIKLPVPNGVYLVQVIGDKLTRTEKVILK